MSKKMKQPMKEGFWFNNPPSTIFLPFVSGMFSISLCFIIYL